MSLNQIINQLIDHKKIDNNNKESHYNLSAVLIDNRYRPISKISNNSCNTFSHFHSKSSGHAEMNAIQSAIKDKPKHIL